MACNPLSYHAVQNQTAELGSSWLSSAAKSCKWRQIQKSKGYNWILVNGQITFEDGEPTGALPGKFLHNGRG